MGSFALTGLDRLFDDAVVLDSVLGSAHHDRIDAVAMLHAAVYE